MRLIQLYHAILLFFCCCFCCCCLSDNHNKHDRKKLFVINNTKKKNKSMKNKEVACISSSSSHILLRGGSDFILDDFVSNNDSDDDDDDTGRQHIPTSISTSSGDTPLYYEDNSASQQPPLNTNTNFQDTYPAAENVGYYPPIQQHQQQKPYHPPPPHSYQQQQQHNLPPPVLPGMANPNYQQQPLYNHNIAVEEDASSFTSSIPDQAEVLVDDAAASLKLAQKAFDKDYIFQGLKKMYRRKIMPLEIASRYGHFSHSPPLSPSDFDARPMVLLIGQYSVGKTSFIRYLLGNRDFPGMRIGPEPTTDRFTIIMDNEESSHSNDPTGADKIIPGAALAAQADKPFRGLSPFGNAFLSRLEGIFLSDCPILKNVTLVDTPGILAGRKQSSVGRNYDYEQVMKWFAERADLIIIMFDAHKLDISDELKKVIELMIPHQDKVRVLLNKADQISTQHLMRVYGALMWSLGKVMNTPEVCRVYIGSFWDTPLVYKEQALLFQQEQEDLLFDISQLPVNAVMRRINELVKRARSVKVHAYIVHYLRKQLPYTFGKREKQRRLIERLDREFVMCARRYELPKGDFPPLESFRQALLEIPDLSDFPKLDKRMIKEMDKVFSVDIPQLLEQARMQ